MGQTHIKVEVKIEPGTPTPAQLQQWRVLWQKLLSEGQKQANSEAEKGQSDATD